MPLPTPEQERKAVLALIGEQDCVLSAREIADELRAGGNPVGVATVYRTLELLESMRLVQRLDVGDGSARYEPALPGGEHHHHHLICDSCGRVTPFEDPKLERAIDELGRRLDYAVGDSFGLFPTNDPTLVDAVLEALGAPPDFPIGGRTLREVLCDGVSLSPAPDMLFQLFSYITGGERRKKAKALSVGEDPDGDAATLDVLAAIEKFPGVRPDPEAFIEIVAGRARPELYRVVGVVPGAEANRRILRHVDEDVLDAGMELVAVLDEELRLTAVGARLTGDEIVAQARVLHAGVLRRNRQRVDGPHDQAEAERIGYAEHTFA